MQMNEANSLLGGRCLDLTLTGNESVEDVMRLSGLEREPAAEILAFAQRLAKKPRRPKS